MTLLYSPGLGVLSNFILKIWLSPETGCCISKRFGVIWFSGLSAFHRNSVDYHVRHLGWFTVFMWTDFPKWKVPWPRCQAYMRLLNITSIADSWHNTQRLIRSVIEDVSVGIWRRRAKRWMQQSWGTRAAVIKWLLIITSNVRAGRFWIQFLVLCLMLLFRPMAAIIMAFKTNIYYYGITFLGDTLWPYKI